MTQARPNNYLVDHNHLRLCRSDRVRGVLRGGVDPPQEATPLTHLGITNQREMILVWSTITGVYYYIDIVWDDTRTAEIEIYTVEGEIYWLRSKNGLLISIYFAVTNVRCLVGKLEALREDLEGGEEMLLRIMDI